MSLPPVRSWADAPAREYAGGKLSDLLGELVWRTEGCTDLERRKALERAADVFLRRSKAWREAVVLPPPVTWEPTPVFRFGPAPGPAGGGCCAWCRVSSERGVAVGLVSAGGPDRLFDSWRFLPGERPGLAWVGALPPMPPRPPEVYLTIAPGSDDLPEGILSRWGAALADGAYAELALKENKPWSDRLGALQASARFHAAIAEARAESEPTDALGHPTVRNPVPFV